MVSITHPTDTSARLAELRKEYRRKGRPLEISFRRAVPWIPYNSPRFTHPLHSYPAKVIPHIPHFFLSAREFTDKDATVLDPFSGSGTVALEACLAGCEAIASDSNPLARLLTRVKTTPISPLRLHRMSSSLRKAISSARHRKLPDVVNLDYWYPPEAIKQLTRIAGALQTIEADDLRDVAAIAFSSCVRKASYADPRVSVPVRLNPSRYAAEHPLRRKSREVLRRVNTLDVIDLFFSVLETYSEQIATLWPLRHTFGSVSHLYENSLPGARSSLDRHRADSVDLIVTSPPYLGAQKYIRATSLSLNWLSLAGSSELRALEDLSIGREHYRKQNLDERQSCGLPDADRLIVRVHRTNPLRARIAAQYLVEMRQVLATCHRVLRPGGHLVLVSGCNTLCGHPFQTTSYLLQFCRALGFTVELELNDEIRSRGLMTRRNRTAGLIPTESVVLFQK